MPNPNKAKGNNWEREVAEHLTAIFNLTHRRVPTSGSMTGLSNAHIIQTLTPAQQLLMVGDIIPPEQLSCFSFECKFYKDIPWHAFLSECAQLDKWIEQAKCPNRTWFLLFKINGKGGHVVFDYDVCFNQLKYILPDSYTIYKKSYVIVKMDNFFEANKDIMLNHNIKSTTIVSA